MDKIYYPIYYDKFKCLAGDCPDTCCALWEICIDPPSLDYYNNLSGSFGDRLRNSIKTDEDGDPYFQLTNGRCPFLNEDNLCDIHIQVGEDHTCEVCKKHPRFTEIYDGFTEISLSLSCQAALQLIMNESDNINFYPAPEYTGDDELLRALIETRSELLAYVFGGERFIGDILSELKNTVSFLAYELYGAEDMYDEYYHYDPASFVFAENFLLHNSEILTDQWREILNNSIQSKVEKGKFDKYTKKNAVDIKNYFAYFLYRHFLKAVNDEAIEVNSAFISFSVLFCIDVALKCDIPFREIARLYSKEIEHDLDNIDLIKEGISTGKIIADRA